MARNYRIQAKSKTFSVRFSANDTAVVEEDIERSGLNPSEYFRHLWEESKEQKNIQIQLNALEIRLLDRLFEMVSAVAGIDDRQRDLAKKAYQARLKARAL
ncbi:hypothetical protein [Vibrio campbellii]|uniref:hypothetical protein n=1 Tax=Vibrio campbellii TaxID=680 RepID=UPI0002AE3047|nr:hypothetical protein [Vibrio campbellii]ARV71438.1 hypothetical protein A8140_01385 [Vibrio campbellii CAIM 519 = NBRC 15631 = ATCC 25920]EKY4214370.1 hypothetical protein [Vibrio alginolyticus]ELI1596682.1 hypothetical protein [Vibrio alginolyticus]ELU50058.1 hypothetical protein B878_20105 [Vibrio campbellii CAIM 519 = NBRC 15631 = ATCC 25920]